MKKVFIITLAILFFTTYGISQTSIVKTASQIGFSTDITEDNIEISELDGNLYVSMETGDETENGFYTFERSYDNENFVILSKRTFHANSNNDISLFTFINKLPQKTATYRVYKFTNTKVSLLTEHYYFAKNTNGVAYMN
jgi:hypothetical protein